tara:strand:+ start:1910 stop:2656 length:747 start_codon:yes stop_codon:yes gene_type:complete
MLKNLGYSYNRSLISKMHINNFFETFNNLLNITCKEKKEYRNFDSSTLTKKIIFLKKRYPNKIKFLYNTLIHTSSFINLFELSNIRSKASKILNCPKNDLIICEHQFRMDYPNDKYHILKPHQDSSFYPQDRSGLSSLVCNVSLHNISKNMGSTIIYPFSHKFGKKGYHKTRESKKSSGQRIIKEFSNNSFDKKIIETKKGDVTFYHMNLIHSSGINNSNKMRYSAIARIFNPFSSSFNFFEKITKVL